MSKELTPLKALKDLREDAKHHLDHHIVYLNERLDIIEKALKENERLRTSYLENLLNEKSKEYIYKKLKALEIIKEKNVDIQYIKDKDCSFEMYNKMVLLKEWRLTQEEYELLKEVLK